MMSKGKSAKGNDWRFRAMMGLVVIGGFVVLVALWLLAGYAFSWLWNLLALSFGWPALNWMQGIVVVVLLWFVGRLLK